MTEKKRLRDEYDDMVAWLMMLNTYPRYKLIEDNIKPVALAYNYMNEIPMIIETSDQKLKQERDEIENALMEQIGNFNRDIEDVKAQVSNLKNNNLKQYAQKYVNEINDLNNRLKTINDDLKHINLQQQDLDIPLLEQPIIDELKIQIKPFEELWTLQVQFD